MIVTHRERGRDTGRGRSRLHAPGARRGIRSRVSRIAPWAKGRRQTTGPQGSPLFDFCLLPPPFFPLSFFFFFFFLPFFSLSLFFPSFSLFFSFSQYNLFLATLHWAKWLEGKTHLKRKRNSPLSHRVTKSGLQFNVRKPIQKHYHTATGGSRKKA